MHIEMSILMPYLERIYSITLYKEMYIESMQFDPYHSSACVM